MRRFLILMLSAASALTGCKNTSTSSQPADVSPAPSSQPSTIQPDFGEAAPTEPNQAGSSRSRSRHARPAANSQPGVFDFYLLTLSWSPEYCATHSSSPECAAHPGFVVHGLWPQNNDGTYPENCSKAAGPTNPGQYINLIPTVSLIEHEWSTHGTCSGLAPDAFFGQVGNAFHEVKIPAAFTNTTQQQALSPAAILGDFATANSSFPKGSFALSCGNNVLTAVEVCLTKTLAPEACQSVKTCGATSVKVPPQ